MLHRVNLRDYRNIPEVTLELGAGFTLLVGKNGAGKTNLLEAIYLLSTLRSFRTSDMGGLVRHGCERAQVSGAFTDTLTHTPTSLRVDLSSYGRTTRKQVYLHDKLVRSAVQAYGNIRCVLFTPEDLSVLRGSPQGRRQLWDRLLFARDRGHILDVQTYEKLLRSRNHVLKQTLPPAESARLLEVYESELAQAGARITTRRLQALAQLRPLIQGCFREIHPSAHELDLAYESVWLPASSRGGISQSTVWHHGSQQDAAGIVQIQMNSVHSVAAAYSEIEEQTLATQLQNQLAKSRPRDLLVGTTGVGPHRDDLTLTLDGHGVQDFASQGQTRAVMLAIKLAELRSLAEFSPAPTLLLLDDVSSEFDPERLAALYHALARLSGQCVITTTAEHHVHLPAATSARWYDVADGTLTASA